MNRLKINRLLLDIVGNCKVRRNNSVFSHFFVSKKMTKVILVGDESQ